MQQMWVAWDNVKTGLWDIHCTCKWCFGHNHKFTHKSTSIDYTFI